MGCDLDRKGIIGIGWVKSVEAVFSTVATLKASGGDLKTVAPLVCARSGIITYYVRVFI